MYLYQAGGPSHLETFDYKPKLAEMNGKAMPESLTKGQQIAQLQGKALICMGPQHGFQTFGKSGQQICSLFPHIGSVADDICIVRSMWTEQINHDPAHTVMNTGSIHRTAERGRDVTGWERKQRPARLCGADVAAGQQMNDRGALCRRVAAGEIWR
jgi:hypothetical protein